MKTLATLEPLTNRLLESSGSRRRFGPLVGPGNLYMPAGGGAARAEQIATLEGLAHRETRVPRRSKPFSPAGSTPPRARQPRGGTSRRARCSVKPGGTSAEAKASVRVCDPTESRMLLGTTGLGDGSGRESFLKIPALAPNHHQPETLGKPTTSGTEILPMTRFWIPMSLARRRWFLPLCSPNYANSSSYC